jgi:para-nitrobenzyl esterase
MSAGNDTLPIVSTFSGPVRGRRDNGVSTFRGIRYGAAPLGPDRFKPSRRPQPWTAPYDAFAFGASAMQMSMGLADAGPPSLIKDALAPILPQPDDKDRESEDCLFLNVWTPGPGDGKKRPVMVWLHGGGFAAGSASWPICDGAALARNGDVVVVSINHRLNAFGYLYLGDLVGGAYLQSGNAGMLDIMLAIWWVRDNIANFGGDPGNVTVFGESGGGLKVSTLLTMRSARGLVHKAIIQSGPGVRCLTRETATENTRAILEELKLSLPRDLQKLHELPAAALIESAAAAQRKADAAGRPLWLAPVMDGMTMAGHPFDPVASPTAAMVPLLIGHTRDEGTFFIATNPKFGNFTRADLMERAKSMAREKAAALVAALEVSRPHATPTELIADLWTSTWAFAGSVTIAERKSSQEAPVYAYMLEWPTPVLDGVLGATHALDLPFVFNSIDRAHAFVGRGNETQQLSERMQRAWIAFARNGDPNCPELPDWPAYERQRRATMIFNTVCRVDNDPLAEVRKLLVS